MLRRSSPACRLDRVELPKAVKENCLKPPRPDINRALDVRAPRKALYSSTPSWQPRKVIPQKAGGQAWPDSIADGLCLQKCALIASQTPNPDGLKFWCIASSNNDRLQARGRAGREEEGETSQKGRSFSLVRWKRLEVPDTYRNPPRHPRLGARTSRDSAFVLGKESSHCGF